MGPENNAQAAAKVSDVIATYRPTRVRFIACYQRLARSPSFSTILDSFLPTLAFPRLMILSFSNTPMCTTPL